jgi:hypothetical protein
MRVYEPLVNAERVAVELVNVNGATCPGKSLTNAIARFDQYVAGGVEFVRDDPTALDLGADNALSREQLEQVLSKSRWSGQSVINLIVAPDYEYFDSRGQSSWRMDGNSVRNVVTINAKACDKSAARLPFVSREDFWTVVILHEFCHTLNVPANKSHCRQGRHCTNPGCVLYPRVDVWSVLARIFSLGPPKGLCRQCQAEIREAQERADGRFYDQTEPYNRFGGLVELNQGRTDAVAEAGFYEMTFRNYRAAIKIFDDLLAHKPGQIYEAMNDGVSVYTLRGICHANLKEEEKAVADFERALQIIPGDTLALKACVLILWSSQNTEIRDVAQARSLALKVCELKNWQDPETLDLLACACAQGGDFDAAIRYERQAIALQDKPKARFMEHLESFRNEKTCAE